jgi:hypothetical protein
MPRLSWITFVFALVLAALPLRAEETAAAPDADKIAAARELLEVTGVTKQLDGMIASLSKGFAKGAKADESEAGKKMSAEFDSMMAKFLTYKDEMMQDFAELYAETFTAAEMKEVANFYRSGTGAKFITAMPVLMQKGSAIGLKYSQRMIEDMKAGGAAPANK